MAFQLLTMDFWENQYNKVCTKNVRLKVKNIKFWLCFALFLNAACSRFQQNNSREADNIRAGLALLVHILDLTEVSVARAADNRLRTKNTRYRIGYIYLNQRTGWKRPNMFKHVILLCDTLYKGLNNSVWTANATFLQMRVTWL